MKGRLDDLARKKLLGDLRDRCDWDLANPDKDKKGREDMRNISPEIDHFASTAYLRGEVLRGKWEDKLPECAVKISKKEIGRLTAIQEGSIRTGYRLVHGITESDKC